MEDQEGDDASSSRRWTCEACGCNTNEQSDNNCTICGTSNSGPSILRRAVGGPGYAARPAWFARGFGSRRGIMNDDIGFSEEDLWESVVDGAEMAGEDPESAMESLAMEVSGLARRAEGGRQGFDGRQRFLDAARASLQAAREAHRVDPTELFRFATENAASYHPHWANPSQMVPRIRASNGIEVGEGERQNLAHLPTGAGEGRAIRAEEPLPRSEPFGSFNMPSPSNASQGQRLRRTFGFRVAFDHPTCEPGANMGGYYLVGVTTSSFTAYGEQNGLQQSPFFWGIEDGGHKYEGSRYAQAGRGGRRGASGSYAVELGSEEAPLNDAGVLFGSREVITVICDFESRTLTFWRDETLLGTLVVNLPRGGNLYPIAVPFNCGVTVAITGMDNDPLPLLRTFATDWRKIQQEKDDELRQKLAAQRSMLIQNGQLTSGLLNVLKTIFSRYTRNRDDSALNNQTSLEYTRAARLWYRCGMKLASLDSLLGEKSSDSRALVFGDFIALIEKVVQEDEKTPKPVPPGQRLGFACEVGDRVELVQGYEKYGDAAGGPLQPGDRGVVVELQRGPNGEKRSVRVLHNGRRWWYQPQAVLSEKSGLIESPSVWFLGKVMRSHGYDHTTLESLSGRPVTSSSWRVGDVVIPRKARNSEADTEVEETCFGRIMAEPTSSTSSLASQSRDEGTVLVEFVDSAFGRAVGAQPRLQPDSSSLLDTQRVRISKLAHFSSPGCDEIETERPNAATSVDDSNGEDCDPGLPNVGSISDRARSDVAGLARLDRSSIESVTKECKRSSESLASLFSSGLPEAILAALGVAERQMNSLEPREDLPDKISAVGSLAVYIADELFSEKPNRGQAKVEDTEDGGAESESSRRTGTRTRSRGIARRLSSAERRQHGREVATRRDGRSEGDRSLGAQGLAASLQQRRSMLLSLMSRARRSNASYFNEMMEAGSGSMVRDLALGQVPPPLGNLRGAQAFVFGPPSGLMPEGSWEEAAFNVAGLGLAGGANDTADDDDDDDEGDADVDADAMPPLVRPAGVHSGSYLDSVLRCRGDPCRRPPPKGTATTHSAFLRHLIATGLLHDNLSWVRASTQSGAVIRNVSDDDGTPVLELAVSFGCSPEVVEHLIACGAPVVESDMRKAAMTNQPRVLASLLQHSSYPEGQINLDSCSPEVISVLSEARARQEKLEKKMRDSAGEFMVSLVKKLFHLARQRQSPACSRIISEVLIGNVLLQSLQRAQEADSSPEQVQRQQESSDRSDRSGRFKYSLSQTPQGLLGSLPEALLSEALFAGAESMTTFLLLVEDCLCSKDMSDASAGLTFLSTLLKKFPKMSSSLEIGRYGMKELVSFHDALASSRLAEILSRQIPDGSEACVARPVRCPKKHIAVLHVTRHSSFRCDICGTGVDRGKAMHGCRECDWDACGDCTDKGQGGIVKCSAIKDLAFVCKNLLSMESTSVDHDLSSLSVRLGLRDSEAVRELVDMLNKPGRVTVHEFITWILPPLHAACSGRSSGSGGELLRFGSGHRSKKARVVDDAFHDDGVSFDSLEERLSFCKEVARVVFQERPVYDKESDQRRLTEENSDEDGEDPSKESGDTKRLRTDSIDTTGPSELLRRLHQILSLHENLSLVPTLTKGKPGSLGDQVAGDLQALTNPLEIELLPSTFGDKTVCRSQLVLQAEPLLSMADLELHVLRTCKLSEPSYMEFCRSIALGNAIIIERPARSSNGTWQLAHVIDFDERTGAHTVRYGARWKRGKDQRLLEIRHGQSSDLAALRFDGPDVKLVLAVRECYVLDRSRRARCGDNSVAPMDAELLENTQHHQLQHSIGSRVQSNCGPDGTWQICTVIGVDCDSIRSEGGDSRYVVVSDDGILSSGVRSSQIRPLESAAPPADSRDVLNRAFGFSRSDSDASTSGSKHVGTLKRTWSALSLIESMRPVELNYPEDSETAFADPEIQTCVSWKCKIGDDDVRIVAEPSAIQLPPRLSVKFSADEKLPGIDTLHRETTLVNALKHLHERHQKWQDWPVKRKYRLFYSVWAGAAEVSEVATPLVAAALGSPPVDAGLGWTLQQDSRSRKLSALSDSEESCPGLCDGLDEICIQCMEVVGLLGSAAEDNSVPRDRDRDRENSSNFANSTLSKKLIDQLDDPVSVAGSALPEWCTIAPSFAPHVFSYKSRRMLLERVAFGASRSTLKQQEAKVNIGRLRQRMAALRARAVELVGEAFSGGAEDPTALQLQADELYGMEEALAARVRAAFRAAKWQEHALQVAKAAVRRPRLLHDASFIMEKYANDPKVSNRRLEVRFDGESGFDQASGDEAGVTRGFYADVSEALLSSDTVAGVYCCCPPVASLNKMDIDPCAQSKTQLDLQYPDQGGKEDHAKFPLWIPDFDSSGQVVIPTPRANECSGLGVYPRPLPRYHPQMDDVLQRFRFIGRLFAAAMRDGFMFPLPLSTAFLKLVQQGTDERTGKTTSREAFVSSREILLTSGDLPRPGFLGGEVYAADIHICKALDRVDMSDPPLSRHEMQKRYEEIASDKNFARVALGKSYDCSFEDYFQDRSFVDPLDPTQGEDAVPLCPNGHRKTVTIFNVREWVALAKNFILHDGVIAQALAFRRGVEDFFSVDYLRLFTPEELQRDVCGVGDNVDSWDDAAVRKLFKLDGGKGAAEALVAVAAIGGEGGAALSRRFGPGSPTINYLVNALLEASPKQRRQFLSFVTSVPIVTPGRIEVVPIVSPSGEFLPMKDPSCLPRANTCARRLYLPKFETYESFSQVLWAVVREESKFKGFFEWRG